MISLEDAIRDVQRRHQLFLTPQSLDKSTPQQTVLVGVSGGADSVCLLHILCHLAAEWHLDLHVGHLDHALRPESADDACFVQELARTCSLPFHHHRLEPGTLENAPASLETAARQARRHYLAQLALQITPSGQIPIVALAHHADDQAETVLHHLIRGSGLQGVAGMRPKIEYRVSSLPHSTHTSLKRHSDQQSLSTITEKRALVIHLVRPLLYVCRTTILQYLRAQSLAWREDRTNQDQHYTRNYLRHTVVPALATVNPAVVDAIGRLANLASDEMTRLVWYDQQTLAKVQLSTDAEQAERIVLDLDALRLLPQLVQRGVLRQAWLRLAPTVGDLSLAHLNALCDQLGDTDTSGPHPLLANLAWSVGGATSTAPARISLHRADVMPFASDHLLLAESESYSIPSVPVGESAQLVLNPHWQLTITCLRRSDLPSNWRQNPNPWRVFLDAAQVGSLHLTTPTVGQQFAPLGMGGQHKMLGDFFTDHKIPLAHRHRWPVLIDDSTGEILWVCGLRVAHHARITEQTETVLWLQVAGGW